LTPTVVIWLQLSYKACYVGPDRAVICIFRHPCTLTISPERQSAWMSKITNDGLTRSGTGCRMAAVGVKGLSMWYNIIPKVTGSLLIWVLGIRSFPGWLLSPDGFFPGKTFPGKSVPGWSFSRI